MKKCAEGHLHRALDALAHSSAERVRVAGHFHGDGRHSVFGNRG